MRCFVRLTLFILIFTAGGCMSKRVNPAYRASAGEINGLSGFFRMCERDVQSAIGVINARDLVRNLTHLHRMNYGGKKYYLLERESITEMIQAVTEGVYSDFILVNSHGLIVYTRENDQIFGQNVNTSLKGSPLSHCFSSVAEGVHLEDVSQFPSASGLYSMFAASKVVDDESGHGAFILQIDLERICGLIDEKTVIIDESGLYRASRRKDDILNSYPRFHLLEGSGLNSEGAETFTLEGGVYTCYAFHFNNLRWILIDEP